MTPDKMREQSTVKVKQVLDLMKVLNLRIEARERLSQDGFIEKLVFWIDDEKYVPAAEAVGPATEEKEAHV